VRCVTKHPCGRAHEGLAPLRADRQISPFAAWLEASAYLEDASVASFEILARSSRRTRSRAEDPRIRAALARIAIDETRHAELAWRIAAWSEALLDPRARRRVARARRRAPSRVRGELRAQPEAALARRAGIPGAATAAAMPSALGQLGLRRPRRPLTCSAAA
jgi:hypothetical protein